MEFKTGEWLGRPALQDDEGRTYQITPDGLLSFGDVSRHLLGRQCQYGSRFINPDFINHPDEHYRHPNLALGLRVNVNGSSYHEFGIHPDDVEEFLYRYEAYVAYESERVVDSAGQTQRLDDAALEVLRTYLEGVGVFESVNQS